MDRAQRADDGDDDVGGGLPPGDVEVARVAIVACPYCGESVEITLDPGSGASQQYVEDCEICCQPWRIDVRYGADGSAEVSVAALDG